MREFLLALISAACLLLFIYPDTGKITKDNQIAQMDSSLALVNKVLSDYLKPIEIIEKQQRKIHYRDSLIWDMTQKIEGRE